MDWIGQNRGWCSEQLLVFSKFLVNCIFVRVIKKHYILLTYVSFYFFSIIINRVSPKYKMRYFYSTTFYILFWLLCFWTFYFLKLFILIIQGPIHKYNKGIKWYQVVWKALTECLWGKHFVTYRHFCTPLLDFLVHVAK